MQLKSESNPTRATDTIDGATGSTNCSTHLSMKAGRRSLYVASPDHRKRTEKFPSRRGLCTMIVSVPTELTDPTALAQPIHSSADDLIPTVQLNTISCSTHLTTERNFPTLEVIGAGLMRTGTTSLKCALELLNQTPCYHMSEVTFRLKQPHIRWWMRALERKRASLSEFGSVVKPGPLFEDLCRFVYRGYSSAVDYPTCIFFQELMALYPNAKVILTLKNPHEWVQSCRATTLSSNLIGRLSWGDRLYYWIKGIRGLPELHNQMFTQTLGSSFDEMTDEELIRAYERWNNHVIATVPRDRLLVFNVNQGWQPLCEFLGKAPPIKGIEFPHLNKRADMAKVVSGFYQKGRWIDRFLILLLLGLLCTFAILTVSRIRVPNAVQ
ncbi:Sulfotransferase family [Fasciola hepatica]|uniref:Sulfotransferase family n=1 Tax=Fasciola hepatica TaxID=6192 RepID=A0A4E0S3G8_FASHE|nr:Sulfotransferase family [Fasciola hepatica]